MAAEWPLLVGGSSVAGPPWRVLQGRCWVPLLRRLVLINWARISFLQHADLDTQMP